MEMLQVGKRWPIMWKVNYVMGKMKKSKAPGEVMIPIEILKRTGEKGFQRMTEIVN